MDNLKKDTCVDYTAWDLNCPKIVRRKDRHKLKKMFKRKARRKNKRKIKEFLKKSSIYNIEE